MSDHGIGGFPKGAGCVGCGEGIPKLCVSRIYYFLTFAMLGTFWMLLTTFARYLGLSATQAGIIAGARPLMSGVSVAIWTHIADRFQWSKRPMLLLAVSSHCLLSIAMVFFKPEFAATPTSLCANESTALLRNAQRVVGFSYDEGLPTGNASDAVHVSRVAVNSSFANASSPNCSVVMARSPLPTSVRYGTLHLSLVQTFAVMLTLMLVNEALGASITTLADVATYSHLGKDNYVKFGWIRVFGAVGWAIGVFSLTLAAEYFNSDHSAAVTTAADTKLYLSGNYQLVFVSLAVILAFSFATGALFKFREHPRQAARASLRNTLAQVLTPRIALLAVVIFHSGVSIGVALAFLFWRIQDLGGRQAIMGAASLLATLSDIPAYLLAPAAIRRLGAERVVLIGVACQVVYFVGVGTVTLPWAVLLFQPLMGGMHGLLWAALQAIFVPLSAAGTEALMIGLLHTLMYGFGTGAGSFVGGALVDRLGSRWMFLCVAVASALVFFLQLASVCYFGAVRGAPEDDGFRVLGKSPLGASAAGEDSDDTEESLFSTAEHEMPGSAKYASR